MPDLLTPVLLVIVGFVLFPGAIVAWIFVGGRRQNALVEARVVALTPSRALSEAVVAPGGSVELRATSVAGALKVWLDCDVRSPSNDWSVVVSVMHHAAPAGRAYRDQVGEGEATHEVPFTIGEDSDGVSTMGPVAARRTGALGIPRGDNHRWIQLVALPAVPVGSELFVRVSLGDLKNARTSSFRAFIGLSDE